MDPVVHFELPFDNRERMAKFYHTVFDWDTKMLGQDMGNYVLATTTETGDKGPTHPGAINGGFFARAHEGAQTPSVVIAVKDIKAAAAKVKSAGGKVLGEPMEIPGVGQYLSFTDSEGNRAAMLQPVPRA